MPKGPKEDPPAVPTADVAKKKSPSSAVRAGMRAFRNPLPKNRKNRRKLKLPKPLWGGK